MAKTRNYQDDLLESLKDTEEAAEYLNAALEDGDHEVFLLALRNVAQARVGGMANLAELTGLNRESLYKMLSDQGNPELNSIALVLHALGLKISVGVDDHAA
ncbi:MAG: addiction module antidote protein [Gammaproteobacteria bacterium]